MFSDLDARMMRRALQLAEEGKYTASPNPCVGCVITLASPSRLSDPSEPRIIGEGFHRRKGMPHAEREALQSCTQNPDGATLYVNLEPCCHHGETPPCTEAVIKAGIKRVVIANSDPFERVRGKGIEELRQHGIQVDVGLLEEEGAYLNRFFFHFHQTGLPWVLLKAAVSLDGKIAARSGNSKWITGAKARRHVHRLRAGVDAIVIGANTVRQDDPSLTVRLQDLNADSFTPPTRVVLDTHASIPLQSKLVNTASQIPLRLFVSREAPRDKIHQLIQAGVDVTPVSETGYGLHWHEILYCLAERNVLSVMVEGGSAVFTSCIEADWVNEYCIYIAPLLIGGKDAPSLYQGIGKNKMSDIKPLSRLEREFLDSDTLIRGIVKKKRRT